VREATTLWTSAKNRALGEIKSTGGLSSLVKRAQASSAEAADVEAAKRNVNPERVLPLVIELEATSAVIKRFEPKASSGALSAIVSRHVLRLMEACGTFAVPVHIAKTGRMVSVNATRSTTVRQLKLLVHDQCVDIWPEQQRLKWWAKELEDAQALGKAGVFPGGGRVELQLKASCAMFCGGHTSSKV
jgi:hypothetical protein